MCSTAPRSAAAKFLIDWVEAQPFGRFQLIGAAKSAIQPGIFWFKPEEAEIAKAGIELWISAGATGNAIRCARALAYCELSRAPWRILSCGGGEGITLAWFADQQRAARIGQKRRRVGGESRNQNDRGAVMVGREANAGGYRIAGCGSSVAIPRGGPYAAMCAQGVSRHHQFRAKRLSFRSRRPFTAGEHPIDSSLGKGEQAI